VSGAWCPAIPLQLTWPSSRPLPTQFAAEELDREGIAADTIASPGAVGLDVETALYRAHGGLVCVGSGAACTFYIPQKVARVQVCALP